MNTLGEVPARHFQNRLELCELRRPQPPDGEPYCSRSLSNSARRLPASR